MSRKRFRAGIKRVVPGNSGRVAALIVPLELAPVTGPLEGHAVLVGSLNPSQKGLPRLMWFAAGVPGWRMEGSECTPRFPHAYAIVQGRTLRSVYERTQLSEYCIRYHPKTSIIVTTVTGTWVQTGTRKPVRNYPRGACLSRWVSKNIGGAEGVRGVHSRSADGR